MGAEDKAINAVQKTLRLKGGLGFWVAALVVVFIAMVGYFALKPVAESTAARLSARASKLKASASSAASAGSADPSMEGL